MIPGGTWAIKPGFDLTDGLTCLDSRTTGNTAYHKLWKDVLYEVCVRQEIEAGLEEARRVEFATDKAVGQVSDLP